MKILNNFFNPNKIYTKKIEFKELYEYSIFFRNYIHNVPEDVLKNGIVLEDIKTNIEDDNLEDLKNELKEALHQMILSYRLHGIGYILIKTNDSLENLENEVNFEFPIGFKYLNRVDVTEVSNDTPYVIYAPKKNNNKDNKKSKLLFFDKKDQYKIHKSRLIIYQNFDEFLNTFVPCFSQAFLLNVYIFELVFQELEKRLHNYNFLFLKDEVLGSFHSFANLLQVKTTSLMKKIASGTGLLSALGGKKEQMETEEVISSIATLDSRLSHAVQTFKDNMLNQGMMFTSNNNASMEVIKYDFKPLRDALELAKIGIGANTKEPLTRSFNEQTKGLGNEGKGDQSNYYDFLKGIQDIISTACNAKLKKYFGLNLKFNSLYLMTELEKIENDSKRLELLQKSKNIFGDNIVSIEILEALKEKLFNAELLLPENLKQIVENQEKKQEQKEQQLENMKQFNFNQQQITKPIDNLNKNFNKKKKEEK